MALRTPPAKWTPNAKTWTNFKTLLEGYSKEYYTAPYKVS